MGEAHVTSHVTSQGHVTSQSDRDNDDVQIIEIASDSEGNYPNYLLIVLPSLLVYCSLLSRIENRMLGLTFQVIKFAAIMITLQVDVTYSDTSF